MLNRFSWLVPWTRLTITTRTLGCTQSSNESTVTENGVVQSWELCVAMHNYLTASVVRDDYCNLNFRKMNSSRSSTFSSRFNSDDASVHEREEMSKNIKNKKFPPLTIQIPTLDISTLQPERSPNLPNQLYPIAESSAKLGAIISPRLNSAGKVSQVNRSSD